MPDFGQGGKLDRLRENAVLSKWEFCIAVKDAELITVDEAKLTATGAMPQAFEDAISSFPENVKEDIRIMWAGLVQIERKHPMLKIVADHMGVTDAQLDAFFQIKL